MYKEKFGISLIVLVITILVMVILAGVVVVTMTQNNPIEKAKEARIKTNIKTLLEEIDIYIANNQEKPVPERYPVLLNVAGIDAAMSTALKEAIATEQGKFLVNGLPDIYNIDMSRVLVLDNKKVSSANAFSGTLLIVLDTKNRGVVFSCEGIKLNKKIYYKLEELLYGRNNNAKFITDEYNTYKLYTDGLLTCVGKKSKLSGASKEELDSMYTDFQVPYTSPFNQNNLQKEVIGHDSIFGIMKDGTLWVVGKNNDNKYGLGYDTEILTPTKLNIEEVKEVYPGNKVTFVVKKDGTLWGVGKNSYGELGVGDKVDRASFTKIDLPADVTTADISRIFASYIGSCIITKDNRVYACGAINIFGGPLDVNGNSQRRYTFTRMEYPFTAAEVKTICPSIYGIKVLLHNGDLYTANHFANKVCNQISKHGEMYLVARNVEQIGNAEADMYFSTYVTIYTKDKKLKITNRNTKEFVDMDLEGLDITNLQMISSSKFLVDGKVYRVRDANVPSPKLYFHSFKSKYPIVSADNDYCVEKYVDSKGNVHIYNKGDLVNNIKLVQKEQKRVFGNAKYVSPHGEAGNINIIDKENNLWISLIEKSPRVSVVKAYPNSPGNGGQMELLAGGDYYHNGKKELSSIKDITTNWVYTNSFLTKDNKVMWTGWSGHPFKSITNVPDSTKITTYEEATIPGVPQNAEKIYSNYNAVYITTTSGELYSYGYPRFSGFADKQEMYRKVNLPDAVADFAIYSSHGVWYALATLANGDVYAWGNNNKGQFGDGYEITEYITPVKLNIDNVSYCAAGNGFAIFAKKDGKVYAAGRNEYGQLGTGDTISSICKFVFAEELSKAI